MIKVVGLRRPASLAEQLRATVADLQMVAAIAHDRWMSTAAKRAAIAAVITQHSTRVTH